MSLTINELQKAFPHGFVFVPVDVLYDPPHGGLSDGGEDISEADVLSVIARGGEKGAPAGFVGETVDLEFFRKRNTRRKDRVKQILEKLIAEKKVIRKEEKGDSGYSRTIYYFKHF